MIVASDIAFAEAPRWHDGTLWWSDMVGLQVLRLERGRVETVCEVPERPSGLGWLPDGRLLVVSMMDRRVLRLEPDGGLAVHADLADLAPRRCNDMLVDQRGGAYVGNFGFEVGTDGEYETPCGTVLLRVEADGRSRVVADDLWFPNGMAWLDGGRVLVVAETFKARLTAFDVGPDGDLSRRRVWAALDEQLTPDGICCDASGAIWVASPKTCECVRVTEGGAITHRITSDRNVYACALDERDGRTLFLCTAQKRDIERQRLERNSRILAFDVDTGRLAPDEART